MRTLLPLVLFMTGCAAQSAMTPAQEAQLWKETHLDDMSNGNATAGDAVVRLVISSTHTAQGHLCTGSLVDRSIILTAAHCLEDAEGRVTDPGSVRVELGGDHLPWGRVGVKRVHVCEDVSVDLAAVVISQPVPIDVPILGMRGGGTNQGEIVSRVGFGTGSRVWSIPLPGEGAAPIIDMVRQSRTGRVTWASDMMIATTADASYGDSGGPILGADGSIVAVATAIAEQPDDNTRVTLGVLPDACPGLFAATLASR